MLYVAVFLSLALLIAITLAARQSWYLVISVALGGLASAFFLPPYFWHNIIPVALANAILICLIAPIWRWTGRGWKRMLIYSSTATIIAYAIFLPGILRRNDERIELAKRIPFVSMDDRIPNGGSETDSVSRYDPKGLYLRELAIEDAYRTHIQLDRVQGLEILHEQSVQSFIDSWGFGFQRMPPTQEWELSGNWNIQPAPTQPVNPSIALPPLYLTVPLEELEKVHSEGVLDFLHPQRFGYVKDRQHVAGFQSHRFDKVPGTQDKWEAKRNPETKEWKIARLELVSLLMHKEPSVYFSDRLPQMDALKGVPTRPLDAFETEGLAALRKGEDLFVREDRMLGSIRSVKQCIACHGGERGQLLGAFTYTLRPAR